MVRQNVKRQIHKGPLWHFHSAQLHIQTLHRNTIRTTVSPCQGKGSLLLNNNIKALLWLQVLETEGKMKDLCLWTLMFWRDPTDLTQKSICHYWERCHHTQGPVLLRYTINGAEWLPRMPCGLVPEADIIWQALHTLSILSTFNQQTVGL